jgi:hypothetical protein
MHAEPIREAALGESLCDPRFNQQRADVSKRVGGKTLRACRFHALVSEHVAFKLRELPFNSAALRLHNNRIDAALQQLERGMSLKGRAQTLDLRLSDAILAVIRNH